jgi:hypothetical protein
VAAPAQSTTLDPQLLAAILALHDQGASAASIATLLDAGDVPSEQGRWDERGVAWAIVAAAETRRRRVGGPGSKPTLDPELVAAIRRLHSEGASARSITRALNVADVPAARSDRWHESSVSWILRKRQA